MSHCGLGHTACNPVLDTIAKFRPYYDQRMMQQDFTPAFDLDRALAAARQMTGRDDAAAHLRQNTEVQHEPTFTLDGKTIPFERADHHPGGQRGRVFIPHLCYHPEFKPHGSCKLCTVKVNGRQTASCTMRAWPAWWSKAKPRKSTPNAGR
jgi:hypothetical protein